MDIRMRSRIGCGPLPTCLLACASLTAPFLMRALELMNRGSLSNPVLIIWKGLRLSSSPSVELSLKLSEHHFCPVQITPPPRYLGTYALPPLTHNNDEIEIEGQGTYVEEDEGGGGGRQTREKQEEEEEGEEEEEEGQGEKEVKCIFLLCWLYTGAYSPQSHLLDCHVLGGLLFIVRLSCAVLITSKRSDHKTLPVWHMVAGSLIHFQGWKTWAVHKECTKL
eukprot:scaffold57649_cov18-Tisochrysis_lutea.AAC.1